MIFGPDQLPTDGNVLTMTLEKVSLTKDMSDRQDTVLEDLITYSDLLFSEISEPQAPTLLPPGSGLSRTGVISYHPVQEVRILDLHVQGFKSSMLIRPLSLLHPSNLDQVRFMSRNPDRSLLAPEL